MTAPTQLEEKVARAIHRTFPAADSDPWDDAVARYKAYGLPGNPPHVALALSAAAAALAVVREALREPTPEMVVSARRGYAKGWPHGEALFRSIQHAIAASPLGGAP